MLLKINQNLLKRFARFFGIEMIILFGSSVNQKKKPEDFDIALLLPLAKRKKYEENIDAYTKLWINLSKTLNLPANQLDITFISPKTPPLLLYYIARDGKLLYGSNLKFSLFRLKAMKIFFDTKLFRVSLDKYLNKTFNVR